MSVRIGVLVWTLAVAAAAAVVAIVVTSDHAVGKASTLALTVPTGLAFVACGLIVRTRRPDNRVGRLLIAAGFGSFVGALRAADDPVLFSLGQALQWAYLGFLVHVVLAFPSGHLGTAADRALVIVGYLLSFALLPLLLAFGAGHVACDHGPCPEYVLRIGGADDVASVLDRMHLWIALAVAVAVLVQVGRHWRDAPPALRRAIAPVFASFGVLIVMLAAQHVAEASQPQLLDAINWLLLAALLAVPLAFLFGLFRTRFGRALEGLVVELATARPGTVRDALARALADPMVQLAYRVGDRTFVDLDGRATTLPAPDSGRSATFVTTDGETVAAIIHDEALTGDPLLEPVTAAAALALENERLQAELRARLEDLRASRARLVHTGDEERRRLERNLHDGAQQRLVALSLSLRLAEAKLARDPDGARDLIAAAATEAASANEELRELARGLHPSILSDRGLGPAVEALASRAPVPVEVDAVPDERLPRPVEVAAYYVVAEALTNVAKYARATAAQVRVVRDNALAVVQIADDGIGGADVSTGSGLRGLRDRVEALDGRLDVTSPPGKGTIVRAEFPLRLTFAADAEDDARPAPQPERAA